MWMVGTSEDRSEIAFFDVETTVPTRPGQGFAILEFGAILVCPRKRVELQSFSTLVRPADLSHISTLSVRCNGITKEAVISAPNFMDIANTVYDVLHGKMCGWAGGCGGDVDGDRGGRRRIWIHVKLKHNLNSGGGGEQQWIGRWWMTDDSSCCPHIYCRWMVDGAVMRWSCLVV
ncbi:NEN1-like [Olea europaea subsp. europaea]|uniref:NEN1-like n=1 Tax=Olea europaea subsp. europaea TaxID=158383 RepID=A0A8S0UM47_OLEEU|nr:NEN1-like [Olea europaea subsp. europaea]